MQKENSVIKGVLIANAVLLRMGRRQHDFNPNECEVAPPQSNGVIF